jgi:glycosyltransferase involved in cell wall biosynthesis
MRVAFYAPLKAPDHPVPSGDRQIARALLQALAARGHATLLASRFRAFDAHGDPARQARLGTIGDRLAQRLIARWRTESRPHVFLTYHVHHKAPDWIGPAVSRALGIPYVVAEASIAPRQRDGAWSRGHAQALAAIRAADTIVFLNPADEPCVRAARPAAAPAERLAPFIDVDAFLGGHRPHDRTHDRASVRLVTVAMMRERAKLASYRMLATALARLRDLPWTLQIVGDGPARAAVEAAFDSLAGRVTFAGARAAPEVAALLRASDVFVWPAIDEAFGLAFLEAQACGVPVIGADTPGVASIVAAGATGLLPPPGDVAAFTEATRRLVQDAALRRRMGESAFDHVKRRHDLPVAAAQLDTILERVLARARTPAGIAC